MASCSDDPSLPRDTVYRAIDGNPAIKIVSSKELELTKGKDRFVCEYSREGDRLRVVVAVFGTKQAVYFTITPEGLRDEKGTMLYRPDRYEQVMREVNAERKQKAANDRLLEAAQKNDLAGVSAALKGGAKPNEVRGAVGFMGARNYAPLHFAAEAGNTDMVTILLDAGANINALEEHGRTPLFLALSDRREQVVKLLVRRGADQNIKDLGGRTALMYGSSGGDNQEELQRWLRTDTP